jgi:hypothetical protein
MGYVLLREFALKAKGDDKLIAALKKHEEVIKLYWRAQEESLAARAKQMALPAEARELYLRTSQAAAEAHFAIIPLPVPKKLP